ncbi:MAG: transcription antitermination factor NusB [bacterium]|nr:transcription antitermination factor NusB [bacterium]
MGIRRQSREAALKLLYAADMTHTAVKEARDASCNLIFAPQEALAFTEMLLNTVATYKREIDELIQTCSMHWSIERIGVVERNILRFSICELLYMSEIPPKVTINEAVEIAKKYGAEDASIFVNGILDRVKSDMSLKDDVSVVSVSSSH